MAQELTNFIAGTNPFNLARPPAWWLQKLHDFDDSLVVIPSKMGFFYRLAQKRPPDPRVKIVHSLSRDDDSKMLASHGLVPVTTILANPRWDNPVMWEDLRQRSPHRMGGAEQFEKLLNEKEARHQAQIARENDEMLTDLGRDAWGYYLMKAGRKQTMWSPRTASRRPKPAQRSASVRILGPDGKPVSFTH